MDKNEDFDKYTEYVKSHEAHLKPYATSSLVTEFVDGQPVIDYYKMLFRSTDEFAKNRYRWRTPYQLDRDSILYSSVFSRLSEKTQLYTGKGRAENRMTHTLKVAQLTRTVCRSLFINEDLGEAIAFGHDCGHTAYAHIGEMALNEWLSKTLGPPRTLPVDEIPIFCNISPDFKHSFMRYGTYSNDPQELLFMHGRQSVRLLTIIRKLNPDKFFTNHTLFGIWRHSSKNFEFDEAFEYKQNISDNLDFHISGKDHSSIEAQVVRYTDDIAWIISDITEGLRSGIFTLSTIDRSFDTSPGQISSTKKAEFMEYLRPGNYAALYTFFLTDLINQSKINLKEVENAEPESICKWKKYISFSDEMGPIINVLKDVINRHIISKSWVYRGDRINKERIITLCTLYFQRPDDFLNDIKTLRKDPDFPFQSDWFEPEIQDNEVVRALAIGDLISILTDDDINRVSETLPEALRM